VAHGSPIEQWSGLHRGLEQDRFATLNQLAVLMVSERMTPFRTSGIIRSGSVADAITQHALEIHADLIVMGVHRAGPIGRVVEAVTRTAQCPVLTIPERLTVGLRGRVPGEFPDAIAC
jgi:nucleotide-binding universal stress UspA family protein